MNGKKVYVTFLAVTAAMLLIAPSVSAADVSSTDSYRVRAGDSLWIISRKFNTTISALKDMNQLADDWIYPGQVLRVSGASPAPAAGSAPVSSPSSGSTATAGQYVVQPGDSLFLIARRFGTTVETLMNLNKLSSTVLLVGQVLNVPGQLPAESPEIPYGGQWGSIPAGVILHTVQLGENLWTLANRYRTSISAIMTTNHLHTDLVQVNQPLFMPQNSSQPVFMPYPAASQKAGFGELLDWTYASWVLDTYNTAVIKDIVTGKSFQVRRLGGSNHADMEPRTAADTGIMKSVYGGQWSWAARAVLVEVGEKVLAASMAGMPHDVQTINDNSFPGHFDLHFLNSRTHNTNTVNPDHQAMVQKAAGN